VGPVSIEPYLRVRAAAGPSFRADGNKLAFRSNESGLTQLWELDLTTRELVQRTDDEARVMFAEYAPVGQALAYGTDIGGNERCQLFLRATDDAAVAQLTNNPDVIHNWGGWSPDASAIAYSSNERDTAFFDVYVLTLDGKQARCVLQHDGNNYVVEWSPSGDALIVSRPTSLVNNDLYLVPLDGSEPRLLTPHEGDARYGAVHWRPGLEALVMSTDWNRDRQRLVILDLATGSMETLAEPEWGVEAARLSPDGRLLAWRTNEDGYSRLRIRDLVGGEDLADLPSLPRGVLSETCWSPDSRRYALSMSMHNHGSDVWLIDLDTREVDRLIESSLAGLDPAAFVEPALVHFSSFDGLEVPAFLYRPPSVVAPMPVIVSVHGGPESQERPSFNGVFQYFVQRGFAVLAPNVRGSTGYGRAYTHLDDVEKRMDAVADLEAAWHWLVDNRVGQQKSIAIIGGSYGGFMVLAALVRHPDLWAAGVDIVGIANFVTFLENTGAYRRKLRECEYGNLDDNREFLERISPIHGIDRINAPLMVVHGANDPRVPVGEAEQIVAGLRARGAPVNYMRFEDEGHGLIKLENRLVAYPAIAEFLEGVLGGTADDGRQTTG
jgi:dipeptidyl aminopeptidase/acylaminoacyl peptidase